MRTLLTTLALLLLLAPIAHSQTPTYPVGVPLTLAWDAVLLGTDGQPANVVRYETRLGSGNLVDVGLALSWLMPQAQLTIGTHTVSVRACNVNQTTQAVQCGQEGSVTFNIAAPTAFPNAPVPRIIPGQQVLNDLQIRRLADSFSYVIRLEYLSPQDLAFLQNSYDGPLPITYYSEVEFLNRMALTLILMRPI